MIVPQPVGTRRPSNGTESVSCRHKSCHKNINRVSPRIGLVHQRDFARDGSPFQLTSKRLVASLTLVLFPLEQFIGKSKMGLNDNIQSSCSHKATVAMDVNSENFAKQCVKTYYARGNDSPSSFMTSAIQIVAERDTPTRQ